MEKTADWSGAYRENYNVALRGGRYGYVALNGTTHEKFYGGIISNNTTSGIWSEAKKAGSNGTKTYNNLEFFGTTLESNGNYDADFSGSNLDYYLNVYSGENSKLSFFGSYFEKANNMAENGGIINFFGCHHHSNSKCFSRNGSINDAGSYGPYMNNLHFFDKLHNLFTANTGATTSYVNAFSNSVKVTSSTNGVVQIATPTINIRSIQNKNLKGVKIAYRYKFNTGFIANTELLIQPIMRLISSTSGRTDGNIINRNFPVNILKNEYMKAHTIEFYINPRFGDSQYLDKEGLLSAIQLILQVKNGSNNPNFSSEQLEIEIDLVEISLITDIKAPIFYALAKAGNTESRPTLTIVDAGFNYFDTTLQRNITWNGSSWIEIYSQSYTSNSTAMSSATNSINTTGKTLGKLVYNTTNGLMYFATATIAVAAWRPTNGGSDILPS